MKLMNMYFHYVLDIWGSGAAAAATTGPVIFDR